MAHSAISYAQDHTALNSLHTLLRSPENSTKKELQGMFFRLEDFSHSFSSFYAVFQPEYFTAHTELPEAKIAQELFNATHEKLNLVMATENEFSTRELSTVLRHFINDACRVLEPLAPLLPAKISDLKESKQPTFGQYLKMLESKPPEQFNHGYLRELFEVWNDYKHRNTDGTHPTPWKYMNNSVIKPKLVLPGTNLEFKQLKNIDVDDFVQKTTTNMVHAASFLLD